MPSVHFKAIPAFINSAAALLVGLAVALFIANASSAGQTQPLDPLLWLSMRTVFWIVGAFALTVGGVCLFAKRDALKTGLILWLALNVFVYQIGLVTQGASRGWGAYLGNLADTFALAPATTFLILKVIFVYLLIGGAVSFAWLQLRRMPAGEEQLKMPCPRCGGRIEFAALNMGQQIPCPHCAAVVTLRKPDESLKMSCFFCKGHIEFPSHALGTKMPCPHCQQDITLIEPK